MIGNRIARTASKIARNFLVYVVMPRINFRAKRSYVQYIPDAYVPKREFFRSFLKDWEHGRVSNNRGDYARLIFLATALETVAEDRIPGETAELGVFKGSTAKVIRRVLGDRKLYLFDTFGGFDEKDTAIDPAHAAAGDFAYGCEPVRQFLGEDEKIIYCVGHFPETSGMVDPADKFAFVHLDCDLYEPTKAALEFFYPRMSEGGFIVMHDYYSNAWPGVPKAIDEFFQDKPESVVVVPDKSGTAVVRKAGLPAGR